MNFSIPPEAPSEGSSFAQHICSFSEKEDVLANSSLTARNAERKLWPELLIGLADKGAVYRLPNPAMCRSQAPAAS
jgi:hypothetical protein